MYFGGNSEMRGYEYLQFVGQNAWFANAELRFPIIEAALTPIGVIGGIRGVFYANIGAGWFDNSGFKFGTSDSQLYRSIVDYERNILGDVILDPITGLPTPVYGEPQLIQGFRLRGRARVVRAGPRDVRARLPDSPRLVVAHADEPGVGGRALFSSWAAAASSAGRSSRSGLGTTSNDQSERVGRSARSVRRSRASAPLEPDLHR